MSRPALLGLHGYKHAGKDTVYQRLAELGGPNFKQFSVADPMKESISALLEIPVERLDELKNDPGSRVKVTGKQSDGPFVVTDANVTMRRFMERYGTQAHRGIFGSDFWLDFWLEEIDRRTRQAAMLRVGPYTWVNTSVRFPNEAEAILERGGEVWLIVGTDEVEQVGRNARDENGDPIPSEMRLPEHLITRTIDNSIRARRQLDLGPYDLDAPQFVDDHAHLDDQVALILSGWRG